MTPFICFSGIAPTMGDAAIGQSILQLLTRRLDLPIRVHSPRPDVFAAFPELEGRAEIRGKLPAVPLPPLRSAALPFRLHRLLHDIRHTGGARELPSRTYAALRDALEGCAAVVVQGGPRWTDPMLTGRQALERWLFVEAARHHGALVYAVGVSCGPFHWERPRRFWMGPLCRHALDRHDILFVRDRTSAPALRRLGATARVIESTDAAVFLEPQADSRYAALEARIDAMPRRRVVVCVRDFQPFYPRAITARDGALRELAAALDHVQREWGDVVFLSTDHAPQPLKETDVAIARRVQQLMRVPGSTVVEQEVTNPAALKRLYGRFDAMISLRLHPAVLALDAGVPCLMLSYDAKCDDFFSSLGLEACVVPLGTFQAEPAIRMLHRMLVHPALRRFIRARYAALRAAHARDYEPMVQQIAARARAAGARPA